MTIFGFTLWSTESQRHIRDGERRIGDALHGLASDLEEVRRLNAIQMGLAPAPIAELPPVIEPRPEVVKALSNGKQKAK